MAVLIDSGVVVGFIDADDAHHPAALARLTDLVTDQVALLASVITYAEVLTGARRGHHDVDVVRRFFARRIKLLDVDATIAERAAELRGAATNKFASPDALVLASAERHAVDLVITADKDWEKVPGVRVVLERLAVPR